MNKLMKVTSELILHNIDATNHRIEENTIRRLTGEIKKVNYELGTMYVNLETCQFVNNHMDDAVKELSNTIEIFLNWLSRYDKKTNTEIPDKVEEVDKND